MDAFALILSMFDTVFTGSFMIFLIMLGLVKFFYGPVIAFFRKLNYKNNNL